jgi:DNA uptake protein ComE-like DNA-binding protein
MCGDYPEVIENLNTHFKVSVLPDFIDINNASLKELTQFYYFRYALAKQIVTYRSMKINTLRILQKIKGFLLIKQI